MENITKDASPKSINSKQPYRTGYHFQPLKNWMNGSMYYKGVYHFFYQHNPDGPTFGVNKMVWGHSVSKDLINWTHLNDAIEPSCDGDINSCFSGSATILPGEKPHMLYTGLIDDKRRQVQNLAIPKNLSDPYLREWEKHPQNPLITAPIGVEEGEFRDPSTAWQGKDGKWRVLIGARNGDEGKAILYRSDDFVNWIVDPNPFYATEEQDSKDKGWAGLQTIPRKIWLDKSGKQLIQWPIEELENLRDEQISITGEKLLSGSTVEVKGITASQADVEVLFELPDLQSAELLEPSEVDPKILSSEQYTSRKGMIGPFGLQVLASKDKTERTTISFRIYRVVDRYICLMISDPSRSSLKQGLIKPIYATVFDIDPNLKTISLRTLIDRSIIESFGDGGRACITSRVYPLLAIEKDAHIYVFNDGNQSVVISQLDDWSMKQAEFATESTIWQKRI
ncbi:Glycosyl hydrolase family 32 protein [Trifolium repens]|nr:Glycosyl hydrolase family 32 protein [Trifolium repens]